MNMNRTLSNDRTLKAVAQALRLDEFDEILCLQFSNGGRIGSPLFDYPDLVGARPVSQAEINVKSIHELPAKSGFGMRFPA